MKTLFVHGFVRCLKYLTKYPVLNVSYHIPFDKDHHYGTVGVRGKSGIRIINSLFTIPMDIPSNKQLNVEAD